MKDPYRKPTDGLPSSVSNDDSDESLLDFFSFPLIRPLTIFFWMITVLGVSTSLFVNRNNVDNTIIEKSEGLVRKLDSAIQENNDLKNDLESFKIKNQNLGDELAYNRDEIKKKDEKIQEKKKEITNLTKELSEYKHLKSQNLIRKVLDSTSRYGEYLTLGELIEINKELNNGNYQKIFTKKEIDYLKHLSNNFHCYNSKDNGGRYPKLSYEEVALDISKTIFEEHKYQCP